MNYRHIYHAGNFADVLKHAVLARLIRYVQNKDAAFKFINFMLDAKNHAWAAQNIDYKVPNKPAMESLPADFLAKFPNMAMPVADLVKFEQLRDVGEAQRDYAKIVSEIKAAQ